MDAVSITMCISTKTQVGWRCGYFGTHVEILGWVDFGVRFWGGYFGIHVEIWLCACSQTHNMVTEVCYPRRPWYKIFEEP